ncbi:hypothetical protein TSAR_011878 [Trichomalopsis sarcophagae]|uniref:Uncharacterized protein n=1 Tax=Trichomalopsis sarcophagae TaxID=543379 RepID=A0A232FH14_9HYME|nr:hypothetical protein TSAR_011878 [Trichomalopsis sarcophagae]
MHTCDLPFCACVRAYEFRCLQRLLPLYVYSCTAAPSLPCLILLFLLYCYAHTRARAHTHTHTHLHLHVIHVPFSSRSCAKNTRMYIIYARTNNNNTDGGLSFPYPSAAISFSLSVAAAFSRTLLQPSPRCLAHFVLLLLWLIYALCFLRSRRKNRCRLLDRCRQRCRFSPGTSHHNRQSSSSSSSLTRRRRIRRRRRSSSHNASITQSDDGRIQ